MKNYQFFRLKKRIGFGFHRFNPQSDDPYESNMALIYEWSFRFLFWGIMKWRNK